MAKDIFDMSDEDFAKLSSQDIDDKGTPDNSTDLTSENTDDINQNQNTNEGSDEISNSGVNSTEEVNQDTSNQESSSESTPEVTNTGSEDNQDNSKGSPESNATDQVTASQNDNDVQAKLDWYEKLSKPFKANGREYTVRSPEELIQLAQQGMGYAQKSKQLKEDRKLAQLIRDNKLDNMQELGFLVDLRNGNKQAIQKLLSQYKINPGDLALEEDEEGNPIEPKDYQPRQLATVDNKFLSVQDTIASVQELPGGTETLKFLVNTDEESKKILYEHPNYISQIHSFRSEIMPSGKSRYDEIMVEIDRLKTFGQIDPDMPFMYAFKVAGDNLYGQPPSEKQQLQQQAYIGQSLGGVSQPNVTNSTGKKNLSQAKAPAKANSASKGVPKDFFKMSEEEFLKSSPPPI